MQIYHISIFRLRIKQRTRQFGGFGICNFSNLSGYNFASNITDIFNPSNCDYCTINTDKNI